MSEPERLPVRRGRYLTDRPQRLGILPTRWFWRDAENGALAAAAVGVVTLPLEFVLWALIAAGVLPFWLCLLLSTAATWLALGVLERYVRAEAARRDRARTAVLEELDRE